jgi:hypothetical protein
MAEAASIADFRRAALLFAPGADCRKVISRRELRRRPFGQSAGLAAKLAASPAGGIRGFASGGVT